MLHALGFETDINATSFKITRWGFMVDEVVVALADMCDGYAAVNPALYDDALEVAKTAYEIMCGERLSWDMTYGSDRRAKLGGTAGRGAGDDIRLKQGCSKMISINDGSYQGRYADAREQ